MREVESEKERETAGCSAQAKPLRGFLTNLPWSGLMPEWGNCAHLTPRGILLGGPKVAPGNLNIKRQGRNQGRLPTCRRRAALRGASSRSETMQ